MLTHDDSSGGRTRRAWLALVCGLAGFLALSFVWSPGSGGPEGLPQAAAQSGDDSASGDAPARSRKNVLNHIADGGFVGFIIIICSLVGFSLAITFAFQLRHDTLVPPEVLDQIEQTLDEENYEDAYAVCEGHPSFFSSILGSGLAKIDRGYKEIESAMLESGEMESNKLHQKVGYLSLIAAISPMLGLFGTVAGMIATFDVIASSETQPKPAALAGGISMALVTTFMGLLVAIPMTILYVYFRNRVVSVVLEVGSLTEELMDRFKSR